MSGSSSTTKMVGFTATIVAGEGEEFETLVRPRATSFEVHLVSFLLRRKSPESQTHWLRTWEKPQPQSWRRYQSKVRARGKRPGVPPSPPLARRPRAVPDSLPLRRSRKASGYHIHGLRPASSQPDLRPSNAGT